MRSDSLKLRRRVLAILACITLASGTNWAAGPEFNYLLHCGGCHLENGAGSPPDVPDLRPNMGYFASFPEGRAYMIRVPGASQAPLSHAQLTDVMNWMLRTFVAEPVNVELYTEEEVAQYKQEILLNATALREHLLSQKQ
jgi:cytochrome c peroxidase